MKAIEEDDAGGRMSPEHMANARALAEQEFGTVKTAFAEHTRMLGILLPDQADSMERMVSSCLEAARDPMVARLTELIAESMTEDELAVAARWRASVGEKWNAFTARLPEDETIKSVFAGMSARMAQIATMAPGVH